MKFVFYTNSVSPHQLPLALALVSRIGVENYRYVYTKPQTAERKNLGWDLPNERWIICEKDDPATCRELLETSDILMSGIRDIALFEKRGAAGKTTFYSSERWFKPIQVVSGLYLPGALRLLHPRYFSYAWKMASLIRNDERFFYYAMGVWAQRDMKLVCRLFCIRRDRITAKIRLWGYFVAPSKCGGIVRSSAAVAPLRLLWVGRMLGLKHVDAIIRAVSRLRGAQLDIYGFGEEEENLKMLAEKLTAALRPDVAISFHPAVSIGEVRNLMRTHDVFVFGSNALEGWGAVVSEALEEGMRVVGTYESGASATILPTTNLYHAGDWRQLARILSKEIPRVDIGRWTAEAAAERLVKEMGLA